MMLGVYLAMGVFVLLAASIFALMIRIDRVTERLDRRIDTVRQARH